MQLLEVVLHLARVIRQARAPAVVTGMAKSYIEVVQTYLLDLGAFFTCAFHGRGRASGCQSVEVGACVDDKDVHSYSFEIR
jgi:hypothetical protein